MNSFRLCLDVAAANVLASIMVLLGRRGDGHLDRSNRGSLSGSDTGNVGGGQLFLTFLRTVSDMTDKIFD